MSTVATAEVIDPAQHLPLAHLVAIRMRRWATVRHIEYADLLQQGFLGLVKAARAFDPSRGLPFATLAMRCCKNEILKLFQAQGCKKRLPPGQRDTGFDLDSIGTEDVQHDHHFHLDAALNLLPLRTKRVISWIYGLDGKAAQKRREVGARLGISRERVRQIEKEGIEALRTALQR